MGRLVGTFAPRSKLLVVAGWMSVGWALAPDAGAAVQFTRPAGGEVWRVGSVETIRWTVDSPTTEVVELCEYSPFIEQVGRLIATVPLAAGKYRWTVDARPWGSFGGTSRWFFLSRSGYCDQGTYSPPIASSGWFTVTLDGVTWVDLRVRSLAFIPTTPRAGWGDPISFAVDVVNAGPNDSLGATVTVPLPDQLLHTTWRCTASPGSSCTPAGQGGVDHVWVRAGGTLHYVFEAVVGADAIDALAVIGIKATVTARADRPDAYPDNNSATTSYLVLDARVVSPNGGEISTIGASRTASWVTSQPGGTVELGFVQGGTTTPIATITQSPTVFQGSHAFTVPSTPGTGRVAIRWVSSGVYSVVALDESDGDFSIVDPAPPPKPLDLNGDGKADILWHNQTTGELYAWFLDGTRMTGGSYLTPRATADTLWQIRAISDLDGDGKVDMLWHHQGTGELYVWFMDGTVVKSRSYLTPKSVADTRWQILGVADFDADGKPDILWHHQTSGSLYTWLMNGTVMAGGSYPTPRAVADKAWRIRGVTDLDRDGKADLLWHHQETGALYVWYMDGTGMTRGSYLTPGQVADTAWQIRRVDDFDGDGQPDVLWHHPGTGKLYVWLLDGSVASRRSYLTPPEFTNTRWQIMPR